MQIDLYARNYKSLMLKFMPVVLVALSVSTSFAQATWDGSKEYSDCVSAAGGNDLDVVECARAEFEHEDQRLNNNYTKALKGADDKVEDAIKVSQRAWILFRDSTCKAQGLVYEGGTFEPVAYTECKARLTAERAEWLEGVHP